MVLFVTEKYERRKVSLWFFSFRVLFACPKRTKRTKRGMLWLPSRRRRHTCSAYVSIPLLISFCRLAATSANKVPRPSNYSIATATGSKRSSADSDLLLCHVRLWRTSRLRFWQKYGCEHSEIGFLQYKYSNTSSVSLRLPPSAPVSATPTAFASQIGQFPTGEGLQNPSAKFHAHFCNSTFGESCQRQECAILF